MIVPKDAKENEFKKGINGGFVGPYYRCPEILSYVNGFGCP
jgi:hypothetical protein